MQPEATSSQAQPQMDYVKVLSTALPVVPQHALVLKQAADMLVKGTFEKEHVAQSCLMGSPFMHRT